MSGDGEHTATVQALVAEVRVLMVGNRQVTLSVYRQLDDAPFTEIEPFGRVRDSQDRIRGYTYVIGRAREDGSLVRSSIGYISPAEVYNVALREGQGEAAAEEYHALAVQQNALKVIWDQLPLIVLAGMK